MIGKNKKPAIIFDLDGTLWDSTDKICKIWNDTLESMGDTDIRLSHDFVCSLMGKTLPEIGAIIFHDFPVEEQIRRTEMCIDAEPAILRVTGANLYDGLEETLIELQKKYSLMIVSNCQDGYIQAFMQAHGLEAYFDDFESAGRTNQGKAENIKLIIERNGIPKEQAIYVGDTEGDMIATHEAGLEFVFATFGFGNAKGEYEIQSLRELPELMDNIF